MSCAEEVCYFYNRAGTGTPHKVPDALARYPHERDSLILARIGERTQRTLVVRGIQADIHHCTRYASPIRTQARIYHTAHEHTAEARFGTRPAQHKSAAGGDITKHSNQVVDKHEIASAHMTNRVLVYITAKLTTHQVA